MASGVHLLISLLQFAYFSFILRESYLPQRIIGAFFTPYPV